MARLSEVLNSVPDTTKTQVEQFLFSSRVTWGVHKRIQVGVVARNYLCPNCKDARTFLSGSALSCLVSNKHSVSVDVPLRCSVCKFASVAWFRVRSDDDLFAPSPWVYVESFTEPMSNTLGNQGLHSEDIDDLFSRAQVAFEENLGAGSMIYLRKIFELVTIRTADVTGVSIKGKRGGRKSFRNLLEEVDAKNQIIPAAFRSNGYRLFSELSEVIHGDSNEKEALEKYEPCRNLVLGIVTNVRNNQDMTPALESLGYHKEPEGISS